MENTEAELIDVSTNFAPAQSHASRPTFPQEIVPGLDGLERTDKVFIIKTRTRIPFKPVKPMVSYYTLLNQNGAHIYTVGQANPQEKDKYFLMELFTVEGQLIFRIIQRWNQAVTSDDEDLDDILPFLDKDQKLPTLVTHREGAVLKRYVTSYEIIEDDPDAQVHVRHANGAFLGHVWKGVDCWIIHDANLMPKYTFPKVTTNPESSKYLQNARHRCGRSYSYYEYYHSHGLEASCSGEPVGFIETEMNIKKFGIQAKEAHCSCAHFPIDLSPLDKALVLAMTLSQYCRASTSAEKAGCACFWLCIVLSLLFCLGSVIGIVVGVCAGVLDNSCRTVNLFTGYEVK